jgi:hypothetical protein
MVHPSDGEAWQYFDGQHPEKAGEARNVRVALATDGFNPYGMSTVSYTCWTVFVIPLNLRPGAADSSLKPTESPETNREK